MDTSRRAGLYAPPPPYFFFIFFLIRLICDYNWFLFCFTLHQGFIFHPLVEKRFTFRRDPAAAVGGHTFEVTRSRRARPWEH